MTIKEWNDLNTWLRVLRDVAKEYGGHTIENIIQQIEARIKNREKQK